jgi:hypothetical protein
MTLIVLDEAELEFLEAVNYYEEAAGLGAQFRDEVSAGVAWILGLVKNIHGRASGPEVCRACDIA